MGCALAVVSQRRGDPAEDGDPILKRPPCTLTTAMPQVLSGDCYAANAIRHLDYSEKILIG